MQQTIVGLGAVSYQVQSTVSSSAQIATDIRWDLLVVRSNRRFHNESIVITQERCTGSGNMTLKW